MLLVSETTAMNHLLKTSILFSKHIKNKSYWLLISSFVKDDIIIENTMLKLRLLADSGFILLHVFYLEFETSNILSLIVTMNFIPFNASPNATIYLKDLDARHSRMMLSYSMNLL